VQFSVILVDGATEAYDGTFKGERNGGLEITRDDKNEPIVRLEPGSWLRIDAEPRAVFGRWSS
jgi:hypothetical protein